MQVIMKDLEKKIIIIFKWLLILLPFTVLVVSWLGQYIMVSCSLRSDNPSQLATDFLYNHSELGDDDNTFAFYTFDFYYEGINSTDFYQLQGPFSTLNSYFSEELGFYQQGATFFRFISHYLDYILYVELFFLGYHLFRYFIYFGVNLFERKRHL